MTLLAIVFALGYLAIVLEHPLRVNKGATALITGVACWTVFVLTGASEGGSGGGAEAIGHHMGELSGILFFLLGAMTIVELIDAHDGFDVITSRITTTRRRKLLIIIGLLTFFLSAVLDNLTTAIVMISLVKKLIDSPRDRMLYGGLIIMAANAGGAWSPIGDVTTTMLWVGGQVTSGNIIVKLIVPSLVAFGIPLAWMLWRMPGDYVRAASATSVDRTTPSTPFERGLVFFLGVGVLLGVPVFKTVTHLPPFMGMLLGLGILWAVTEIIHKTKNDEAKSALSVAGALQRVDAQSILFFLGILLAISALQSAGLLTDLARGMQEHIGNQDLITMAIGLSSAVVDNVPLVAAAQGMYPLATFPTDHAFWEFLAYCAGTGGSILIIGSAAGVAVMGIERISFGQYLRHISLPALAGYLGGAAVYLGMAG